MKAGCNSTADFPEEEYEVLEHHQPIALLQSKGLCVIPQRYRLE